MVGESDRCFRAWANLTEDGRPIASSVRNAREEGMVPVLIVVPRPAYSWSVSVSGMTDDEIKMAMPIDD